MSGLGGLNKSKNGVVIGLVQLQLPTVATPDQLAAQTAGICELVGKARRNMATYAAEQIVGILKGGRPPRLINAEVWPAYAKRFEAVMGTSAQPEVSDPD